MAAAVQGTAHIFGVGATVTSMSITGITGAHGFELNATVENSIGVTVETRRDNRKKTLTITGRVLSAYTAAALGSAVTITGLDTQFNDTYELVSIVPTYSNTAHAEFELTLEKYEGVAVS